MYVCSCHVFTDADVRNVADAADRKVAKVYTCLGCSPECGRCARTIKQILDGLEGVPEPGGCAACPAHADCTSVRVDT